MDCPHKKPLQQHWHHITRHRETATPGQALDITGKTKKEETGPDHSVNTADIAAPAIMTCTEAVPNCNNGTGTAAVEAAQDDPIQQTEDTVVYPTMIHHTSNTAIHPHTTPHQVTPLRTTVDHIHAHPTDCQSIIHTKEDDSV